MLPVSLFKLAEASVGDSCSGGASEGLLNVFVGGMSDFEPGASLVCLVTELVVEGGSLVPEISSEEMGSSVAEVVLSVSAV